MLKELLIWLYVISWQVLRACSAVLLLIAAVLYAGAVAQSLYKSMNYVYVPKDPVVCGKMAGEVYRFSRLYFPFWPEYEGASSFDPDFVNNKKGCDANLRSVFLSMTWPGLEPAEDRLIFEQGLDHEGLLVGISPIKGRGGDLRLQRDHLLSKMPPENTLKNYDPVMNLYRAEALGRDMEQESMRIYWNEIEGEVTSVFDCYWRPSEPNFFACKMTFVVFDALLVDAIMRIDKLSQWEVIKDELEGFLIHAKKKVVQLN